MPLLFFSTGTKGSKGNEWQNGKIWFKPVPKHWKVCQTDSVIVIYNLCDYTLLCRVIVSWLCFAKVSDFLAEGALLVIVAPPQKQIVGVKDLLQMTRAVFKDMWKLAGVQWSSCLYDSPEVTADRSGWVIVNVALTHCVPELAVGSYSTLRPWSVNTAEEMPCQNVSVANHSAILVFTPFLLPVCNAHCSKISLNVSEIYMTPHTFCAHNGSFILAFSQTLMIPNMCILSHIWT